MNSVRSNSAEGIAPANQPATGPRDLLAEADRIKAMAVTDSPGAAALASSLLERSPPPRERLRLLSARAHALCYTNDFDRAAADLAEAAEIADTHRLGDELAPILLVRVQPLARAGRLDEAERDAARAVELFRLASNPGMLGKAEVNLGIVRRMRGLALEAIECFERAAPLLESDAVSLAAVHSNRAVALLELDRFDQAAAAFDQAMRLLRSAGRGHAAAIVTGNIADLLARTGRIEQAIARFDEARASFAAAGAAADAARLTAEEAEALFAVGAHAKCIRLLHEAAPVLRSANLPREHARAQLVLGLANLRLGNLAGARPALLEAARDASFAGAALISAEALIGLAELAAAEGRVDDADRSAARAAGLLHDRPVRRAAALVTQAGLRLRTGAPAEAARCLDEIERSLGSEATLPAPLRARIAHLRAEATWRDHRPDVALRHLRTALEAVESFRGAIHAEQFRTAYLESSQQLFLDLCRAAPEALPPDEAAATVFDAAERLRARTLLDAVRGGGPEPHPGATPDDSHDLAEINALYSSLGPTSADGSEQSRRRFARLRELEARRDSRDDRAAARRLQSVSARLAIDPILLAEAVAAVRPGAAVVALHGDGGHLSAQILTSKGPVLARRLAQLDRIASLCRRFQLAVARSLAALTEPDPAAASRLLIDIHAAVFDPIAAELDGVERLHLVPFGVLHGVPLTAGGVVRAVSDPSYPRRVESYLPGVSVGAALAAPIRSSPRAGRGRVAIIGFSGDSLAPQIEREAEDAAACYAEPTVLIGAEATAERVLDAVAPADLVHLACHAVFDAEFPMSSRLQLADRWITARELSGRIRPGATVLLAGCDTGKTRPGAGEDHFGLVRAVLASRAGAVLSTAWPLHDATSLRVMTDLHPLLAAAGPRCAEALPAALSRIQHRLAVEHTPLLHWANLFVIGALL